MNNKEINNNQISKTETKTKLPFEGSKQGQGQT